MRNKLENSSKIKPQIKIDNPKFYKLILLNDDFTTMDFVVKILVMFLNKNYNEATSLMLEVHDNGSAICGEFPRDIAETLQAKIHNYSRQNKQPLKCIIKS